MELLRFITCGSVDDGKSTLIGRMLYDSNAVQTDLLEAIQKAKGRNNGHVPLDLSLLTDGLKAEREQGITIDVAYKYFSTKQRKFIIADTPGHIQYTRNMLTGASNSQLAILLVDARKGIVEQSRRHAYIASFLRLPHLVLAVNKMDLVDYSQAVFDAISRDFLALLDRLHYKPQDTALIPVSALEGDNIVHPSQTMPWYKGRPLLGHLDSIAIEHDENLSECRFPIQNVIRPRSKAFPDYRAYAGQVSGGIFKPGTLVRAFPSRRKSRIRAIELGAKSLQEAFPPMSVNMLLEDDIDLSRGDLIYEEGHGPCIQQEFSADICWMSQEKLQSPSKYLLQHLSKQIPVIVQEIEHNIDIHSFEVLKAAQEQGQRPQMSLNDLGRIRIKAQQELAFDLYKHNRRTGSFILIDPGSFATIAAGIFC